MTRSEIFEKLKEIFGMAMRGGSDLSNVSEASKLATDLGINSIGMIYLALAMEEQFGVDSSNLSTDSFATVKDVIDFIEKEQSK